MDVPLLGFIGSNDQDLLPHFLDHYRQLGATSFHFALHGPWDTEATDWLEKQADVTIATQTREPFSEGLKCRHLNEMVQPFAN